MFKALLYHTNTFAIHNCVKYTVTITPVLFAN